MTSVSITPRERFMAAFEHKETDRVPTFETVANKNLFTHYIGKDNYYSDGAPFVEFSRKIGLDSALIMVGGYTSIIYRGGYSDWKSDSQFIDEFGVNHTVSPASWPLAMATGGGFPTREAWETMPRPDPLASWRFESVKDAVREAHRGKSDDIAVVSGVRGAFTVMFVGMGFDNMALTVYDDPDLLREMSAYFTDFWTKVAIRTVELGADVVYIANDMGFNTNTLLSPATMREIFLPDLKKQVQAIKATGAKVLLHTCGCVNPILQELVDTGTDALNNIQVGAGMDIAQVKKQYGDRLTLVGNVDATHIMTTKNPDEIEEAVKEVFKIASPGGGHIMATDHSLHGGIPFENVDRFFAAVRKYGKYPIQID